jgi:hypothetical protein
MIQYLWVAFPGKRTGDPLLDGLPPDLPRPTDDQVAVDIQARLILSKSEGPVASQVGTMLDAIAGNARLSGAVAAQCYGSWSEDDSVASTEPPPTSTGLSDSSTSKFHHTKRRIIR